MDLLQGKQAVRNAQQDLMDLLQGKQAVRYVLPIRTTLSPEEVNVLHALKGGMQHQVPLNVASTAPQHPRNPDTVMVAREQQPTLQLRLSMVVPHVLILLKLLLPVMIAELLELILVLAADLKGPQFFIQKLL